MWTFRGGESSFPALLLKSPSQSLSIWEVRIWIFWVNFGEDKIETIWTVSFYLPLSISSRDVVLFIVILINDHPSQSPQYSCLCMCHIRTPMRLTSSSPIDPTHILKHLRLNRLTTNTCPEASYFDVFLSLMVERKLGWLVGTSSDFSSIHQMWQFNFISDIFGECNITSNEFPLFSPSPQHRGIYP